MDTQEIREIIEREVEIVSYGNGFYRWELIATSSLLQHSIDSLTTYEDLLKAGVISKEQFISELYVFFDVVYKVTEDFFIHRGEERRKEYAIYKIQDIPPPHSETLKLSQKELDFITERWNCWAAKESERLYYGFDNLIEPQDFSHIELPDRIIRSTKHVFGFKKFPRQSIREIFELDPGYLIWIHNNTHWKLSEEILAEAIAWKNRYKNYDRSN